MTLSLDSRGSLSLDSGGSLSLDKQSKSKQTIALHMTKLSSNSVTLLG